MAPIATIGTPAAKRRLRQRGREESPRSSYNPQKAAEARRRAEAIRRRMRQQRQQRQQSPQYDPLAPLTGDRERREMGAAERLEFGPRTEELRRAIANQDATATNREAYYDDYKQMLRESTARVNETNRQNVEAAERRVDESYAQDKAAAEQRDARDSETAAKFGRAPTTSTEGARAVEAQRSQGNQAAIGLRGQAGADTKLMELRTANAGLKKIEDQDRMVARRGKLRDEEKELESRRGAFRTDFRRKSRQDEREWAAIQKEFGLKKRGQDLEFKNTAAQRKLELQKANAQKIIARLYSSANRANARAQVRVAKLQLDKGKISRKKYVEIVNIYKGLPERPTDFNFNYNTPGGGNGKPGPGSGPNGTLANHERDKLQRMVRTWKKNNVLVTDKSDAFDRMADANPTYPLWLIRLAWRRYTKQAPGSNYSGPR